MTSFVDRFCGAICLVLALSPLFLPTVARADVAITQTGGSLFIIKNEIVDQEREIILQYFGNPSMGVAITATSGSNPIRYIAVVSEPFSSNSGNVVVSVRESGGTIPYLRSLFRYDDPPDGEVWVDIDISGGVGDPGTPHTAIVFGDIVTQVAAQGTITADIQSGPRLFGGTSTITRVRSHAGSLLGDIYAPSGEINEVYAHTDIGSSTDNIFIWANKTITTVDAQNLYANINATSDGGSGDVGLARARNGGFRGSLIARRLLWSNTPAGVSVAGDLDADLVITEDVLDPIVVTGSLPVGRTISIGRSLIDDATNDGRITFASDGLAGQVIINAGNFGTPGVWSGNVTVGSVVLGPGQSPPYQSPHYGVLSSALGGGAVGLAPFNLHLTDCDPPHGASLEFDPTTTVYLRHYGPVFWEVQSNPDPVRIFWREVETTTWIELPAEDFMVLPGADPRDLVVIALTEFDFVVGFDDRIIPRAGVLKCAEVAGNPDVAGWEYLLQGD